MSKSSIECPFCNKTAECRYCLGTGQLDVSMLKRDLHGIHEMVADHAVIQMLAKAGDIEAIVQLMRGGVGEYRTHTERNKTVRRRRLDSLIHLIQEDPELFWETLEERPALKARFSQVLRKLKLEPVE